MSATKSKPRSAAYKAELAIGKAIADRLPQLHTQVETAKALGMTRQGVARMERRALYKVQQRLREILRKDEIYV